MERQDELSERDVLFERHNGVGVLVLNRPKKLNALNRAVIEEVLRILEECRNDDSVRLLLLEGAGDRAFCAGGDVKSVYEMAKSGDFDAALDLFKTEFTMDFRIADYPKTIVSCLDGITMGGGVGMSISTPFRIVTERTAWAMPEMKIGLFPDVGTSYRLSKLPGGAGHYLCLTSRTVRADDCLYLGLADYKMRSADYPAFKDTLLSENWIGLTRAETERKLSGHLKDFSVPPSVSQIQREETLIAKYFEKDSLSDILLGLRRAAEIGEDTDFVLPILEECGQHSPTSMAVVVEQHKRARNGMTLKQCLDQDYVLVRNFLKHHDFYEGVRTVLIEKSGKAQWSPREPQESEIMLYFEE